MAPSDPHHEADIVTFAGGVLDEYRHVCAFVGTGDDDAVLDPFVSDGVDRGDRLVYLVDPAESAAPVNRLRHLGFNASALMAEHRCEVRTWSQTYLRDGTFDPDSMLDLLARILKHRDSPRIRMIADMGWAAGRPDVAAELIEFEARANFIHAEHRHIVICSYDTGSFEGDFVIEILRTHPMVVIGGMLQENPFFVPPAEFLRQRGRTRNG